MAHEEYFKIYFLCIYTIYITTHIFEISEINLAINQMLCQDKMIKIFLYKVKQYLPWNDKVTRRSGFHVLVKSIFISVQSFKKDVISLALL